MNGKIDNHGRLWIERTGIGMLEQNCPYCENRRCGDWCPHFGEPGKVWVGRGSGLMDKIEICNKKVLLFNSLKDER